MKQVGTQEIRTKRLVLRRLRVEDAEPLRASGSFRGTSEEVAENVKARIQEYEAPYSFHWVIECNGTPIGRVLVWEVSPRDEYCQLGYDIAPEYRAQGFMTEALRAVVLYLLAEAEFNRVYCSVRVSNAASNQVCRKAGMILDGTLRKHFKSDHGFDDVNIYSLVRDDLGDCPEA